VQEVFVGPLEGSRRRGIPEEPVVLHHYAALSLGETRRP
jgi:hypothetical protein